MAMGIIALGLFLLSLLPDSNEAGKEKPMIVVRHLNGDRFPIILIQMGTIQIRKLNYLQISLQLVERHLFGKLVKKQVLGLTWWLRGADSFYRENCNMGAFGKMLQTQTQNAKLRALN